MVSDTGNDAFKATAFEGSAQRLRTRQVGLEGLGVISIVVGAASVVLFFIPGYAEVAWAPALVALTLGAVDLGLKVNRRRFAIAGMMLAVIAFSWSVAMVLFGRAS